MKLPVLFPPDDLLKQIEGVESGLRRRRYLGNVGAVGTLLAVTLQTVVLAANSEWWDSLRHFQFSELLQDWPFLLGLAAIVFFFALFGWSRFWLQESREAFRYSCSIADFEPILGDSKGENPAWLYLELREKLACLSHDLAERFSQRVSRIRFRDKPDETETAKPKEGAGNASHIHIRGVYVLRKDRDDEWVLEIMPRVRIGPSEASEALAHRVVYRLGEDSFCDLTSKRSQPAPLDRNQYERIQERLYFSVATEVYKQIQEDVAGKIELLPTSYFRAISYFYEAEDYSRSNTLDAYKEASKLYGKAVELFDPQLKPLPSSPALRTYECVRRALFAIREGVVWLFAFMRPRSAHRQLMCARAEIGYANMLLYRRILAGISGQRLNQIFEARPIAADAVRRLRRLPADTPERRESLFDAYVTVALAWLSLGAVEEPERWLDEAKRLDPARCEEDPKYLFASGRAQSHLTSRMNLLRRAVELEPRFEVAQWLLAITHETLWRTRPSLERNVARIVLREYEEVLKINPGNVSAWANRGYVRWLLYDEKAKQEFENGLEYKAMRPQTFISALDSGLARIAAEQGDMVTAYKHYVDAVSALLAEGVFHEPGNPFTEQFGKEMLERIKNYKETVQKAVGAAQEDQTVTARVKNSVYAFALNDYGEACCNYFLRHEDISLLSQAKGSLQEAIRLNPHYVIPVSRLSETNRQMAILEPDEKAQEILFGEAVEQIEKVTELEPNWPDGTLKKAELYGEWAKRVRKRARQVESEAAVREAELKRIEAEIQQKKEAKERKGAEANQKREEARRQYSEVQGSVPAWSGEESIATEVSSVPSAGANTVGIRTQDVSIDNRFAGAQAAGPQIPARLDQNPEIEAERLKKEATSLLAELQELESKANELREQEARRKAVDGEATEREKIATQIAELLLPHPWLWVSTKAPGPRQTQFRWQVLDRNDYVREWKWERELNDLHARALHTWALARGTPSADAQSGLSESERRSQDRERQRKLVVCLLDHFFPGNFQLLEAARELTLEANRDRAPDALEPRRALIPAREFRAEPDYNRDIRAVIENWVAVNPAEYWALTWLTEPAFSQEDPNAQFATQTMKRALEQPNVSPHTCYWIGWQCQARNDDLALEAYRWVIKLTNNSGLLADTGARLEELTAWHEAQDCYERALALAEDVDQPAGADSADKNRFQLVKVLWKQAKYEDAIRELEKVKGKTDTSWICPLVEQLLSLPDHGGRRQIESWLERHVLGCRQHGTERTRRDANEAILCLARRNRSERADRALPNLKSAELLPVLTPVAVEAEATLFPEGEEWTETHPLFKKYVPEMRDRIRDDTGVRIPGIRFRGNQTDLAKDTYLIMLEEIPLAAGSVVHDRKFCPRQSILQEAAGRNVEGIPAPNPKMPGHNGLWLAENDWPIAEHAALRLWDCFEYIVAHTESLLRANLCIFLGLQEVENMLEVWQNSNHKAIVWERAGLAAEVLPDVRWRLKFTRLLQELAAENVPINDFDTILGILSRTPTGSGPDLLPWVEAVRLGLRERLPGNHAESEFFWLSPRFEEEILAGVEQQNGSSDLLGSKTLFSLSPETAQDLLAAVRSVLSDSERPPVLVTRAEGIRPFVRRLIRIQFPYVHTLSLTELHGNLRDSVRRMIEL
jgi:FHIPEP family protein